MREKIGGGGRGVGELVLGSTETIFFCLNERSNTAFT